MRKEFLIFLVVVSLVSSCKRNVGKEEERPGPASAIGKAQSWLEAQKQVNKPYKDKIQQLSDHLEWSLAKTESYANRNLIVIPIKRGYVTANNKGKDPSNYLVLFVNQEQQVSGGRIVQYVNPKAKATMPEKAVVKILNNEYPGCEGSFSFTNIVDRFLYELKFSSGKKTDFVYMTPKAGKTEDAGRLQSVQCHDWYLITTHYNEDGTVEVWEDYLGRTCDGCTPTSSTLEVSLCGQFEGGSGGGLTDECCLIGSNASLQTSSQSIMDNKECGDMTVDPVTGKVTKTCIYTWTYNTSSFSWVTWTYSSIEVGELENAGLGWKFKNFYHSGTRRDGDTPTCMLFQDGVTNAVPSTSADGKHARIDLAYWISSKISCVPFAQTDKRDMTSYANFNAE